jgi:uncharacterized cupin superfamily protein
VGGITNVKPSMFNSYLSVEDELVFIIQGEGSVWLDGHVFSVSAGDAIGFKGGTGLAHTIINDSNASGEGPGQDLVMWIVGENRRSEDKVVYPLHPEKKQTFKRWWQGKHYVLFPVVLSQRCLV